MGQRFNTLLSKHEVGRDEFFGSIQGSSGNCTALETNPKAMTCALRVSKALKYIGVSVVLGEFDGNTCSMDQHARGSGQSNVTYLARGAQDLANMLWARLGPTKTDRKLKDLEGKQGIVFFMNLDSDGVDHIDLWDGKRCHSANYDKKWFTSAQQVWFWEIKD